MQTFSSIRNSLVDRVVDSLVVAIGEGSYLNYLPGERPLVQQLGVSRSVVRAALKVLDHRGLIKIEHGKRTRILARPGQARQWTRVVCVLCKGDMTSMSHSRALGLLQLQQQLSLANYTMKTFFKGPPDIGPPIRRVRQLVEENPADCWVLYSGNLNLQRFFNSCETPTFLMGRPNPGVTLPHSFVDYGPACRHAVGKLMAAGHRRIGLIMDATPTQSHQILRESFHKAFDCSTGRDSVPIEVFYEPSRGVNNLDFRLLSAIKNPKQAPTALIAELPSDVITVGSILGQNGLLVPKDVSLVCLGNHPVLGKWRPPISCYKVDELKYTNRVAQVILRLAREGVLPKNDYIRVPEFVAGGTIAIQH